jgi:glycerophosphoryl diester phosphodiesterase
MAHRGSSLEAPENSLSAIRLAMKDGADMVEIDVQETADGIVVLLHDSDLARIAGVRRGVHEMTYEEIRLLDAGSWFSEEFAGERIPTLREALEIGWPTVSFNVELKYAGHDRDLAGSVLNLLDETGCTECIISSLNQDGVAEVRQLAPERRVGLIVGQSFGNLMHVDADFFSMRTALVTRDFLHRSRQREREVYVWTVNDPVGMSSAIALGVDGILTDNPALLRSVIEERAKLTQAERFAFSVRAWVSR